MAGAVRARDTQQQKRSLTRHPTAFSLVHSLGGTCAFDVPLRSLGAAWAPGDAMLVNCSGLGAAALCGDASVAPTRGVLVLVRCPGLEGVYCDESLPGPDLAYVVPKGGGVVACGGCAQPGATRMDVPADEAAAVLRRCEALLPALRGAPVLSAWAGLRPVREAGVRLELVVDDAGGVPVPVLHNYGCVVRTAWQRRGG